MHNRAVDPRCQGAVQEFMLEMASRGEPYASAVRGVLESFVRE
jgi:hypothetical protein